MQQVDVTRFHLSLNVNDLNKSVQFLTALLGCPPKKYRSDYAKFEPTDLPVVLSLEPRRTPQPPLRNTAGEGPLNHVGIRMTDASQLVQVEQRLAAAGYATQREDGVECCYARQTKFWILDHDRTMWEVYVLDEDLDHRGQAEASSPRSSSTVEPRTEAICEQHNWVHRLSEDFPSCIPGAGDLDEVLLQGTWNAQGHEGQWSRQLSEVRSSLRPGGKLVLHLLTANEAVERLSPLPGRAAVVQVVPVLSEVVRAVEAQGFVNLQLVKYGTSPCFVQKGIEMRETRLEASTPQNNPANGRLVQVVYRGPFSEISADEIGKFVRGEPRSIPIDAWERLAMSNGTESFTKLAEPASAPLACTGSPA